MTLSHWVSFRIYKHFKIILFNYLFIDHLCGLVIGVPGYRSRVPGFDSLRYHIFWEVVGMERGPLKLMNTIEELLERKSSGSGLKKWDYSHRSSVGLITRHPLSANVFTNFADKRRSLGRCSSFVDQSHGDFFIFINLLFMVHIYYSFYLIQMISVFKSFSALRAVLSGRSSTQLLRIWRWRKKGSSET
jgi:hypothetical protein